MPAVDSAPPPTREARRARGAVAALFLTDGALFADLVPRLPEISSELLLDDAAYGVGATEAITDGTQNTHGLRVQRFSDEIAGLSAGTGATLVSWRLGVLLSPPLVGPIADSTGLRAGQAVVPLAASPAVVHSPVLSTRRSASGGEAAQ